VAIRVVLGDDNVLVREGVRALLAATEGIDVVAVAEDAPSLIAAADEYAPDVVVTDIKMPPNFQLEGIEAAHEIRRRRPGTGVVVLSAHDDAAYALALLGGGDRGLAYLLKDRLAQGEELARAIREVAAGGSTIDPTIAARLSGEWDAGQADREMLDLMAKGAGYTEMAHALGTTEEAIDRMVTGAFQRLAEQGNVDVFKRLHSPVVDREVSTRTLRAFVPEGVADRLPPADSHDSTLDEVEATILFSDIRGFSTIAEHLPARQVAAILNKHLSAMAEVVSHHGGMNNKFAGDGVMAVFGAPEAVPDHPERALRCALAMQARHRELNWEDWTESLPEFGIGIGVNTGTVAAGFVGTTVRREYTVYGDAVNVAQRLQSEALAGEVLATAGTVASAPTVRAEPAGARLVKGRSEAVECYRILQSEET